MLLKRVECFAGDLSEQGQKVVWATHFAPAADLFAQKLDGVAWRSKPSSYIVATKDRTVQPELQRFVAKRMTDLKLAPFHLLASEGAVHTSKDHLWHMETLARICQADIGLLLATPFQVVDLTDRADQGKGIKWWGGVDGRWRCRHGS